MVATCQTLVCYQKTQQENQRGLLLRASIIIWTSISEQGFAQDRQQL